MAEFIFPLIAIAVVASVVGQMLYGQFAASSIGYVVSVGGFLAILSLAAMARAFAKKPWKEAVTPQGAAGPKEGKPNYLFVAALLLLTVAAILLIDKLGYIFVLFVYLMVLGRLFYRGSWWVTLGASLGMVLFVHFLFVEELQLGFPQGSIWHDVHRFWAS